MFRLLTRTVRRTGRRFFRPAVAFVLVLAQAVTAFGYPVATRAAGHYKACGCPVAGPDVACCCEATTCCAPAAPEPDPEPDACPKCKAKLAAKAAATPKVKWVVALKARQCRGEGPLGLFADLPAVPPAAAPDGVVPPPCGVLVTFDHVWTSSPSVPLDPPPRCG